MYYYGDCLVKYLNLYVVNDAGSGSGTYFSGSRSGIVLTLKFSVVSTIYTEKKRQSILFSWIGTLSIYTN